MASHYKVLRKLHDARDARGAAAYIANQTGLSLRNAVHAAARVGFQPEVTKQYVRVTVKDKQ
jgi:hypothetical protein